MSKALVTTPSVGAVKNALALVQQLVAHDAPAGVNGLARAAHVSPSTSFNILKTFVAEGFVEFDPKSKLYSPGPELFALAAKISKRHGAFAQCAPLLARFANEHAATVALWQISTSERLVLVGVAESDSTTRIHMTVGQRLPMLVGAMGRCVAYMLHLSGEAMAKRFTYLRWDNPPSLQTYLREVEAAKKRGWALDDGDLFAGVTTVAAPIAEPSGALVFVLTASFFRGKRLRHELPPMGEELKKLAAKAARVLAP